MSSRGAAGADFVVQPNALNANELASLTVAELLPADSSSNLGSSLRPFSNIYAGSVVGTIVTPSANLDFIRFPQTAPFSARIIPISSTLTFDDSSGGALNVAVTGNLTANTLTSTGNIQSVAGTINSRTIANFANGPASSTSTAVPRYNGTGGKDLLDSGVLIDGTNNVTGVATINTKITDNLVTGPTSSTDNRVVRMDSTTGRVIQESPVAIDDSGNATGLGTLNTRTIANWTDGPATSTSTAVPRYSGTGGKTLLDSGVLIDGTNNVTGVATINTKVTDNLVTGPTSTTDNRLVRMDLTTGRVIQDSAITVDDSGNITGAGTLNTRTIANWTDGPASATDNAIAVYNGTGGKTIKNSTVTISSGTITATGLVSSLLTTTGAASSTTVSTTKVTGDAVNRSITNANGDISFGSGAATNDVRLRRTAAGTLAIDNNAGTTGGILSVPSITSPANLSITPAAASKVSFDCTASKVKLFALDASPSVVLQFGEAGTVDTFPQFEIGSNGGHTWGTNVSSWDIGMGRNAAKELIVFNTGFGATDTSILVGTAKVQGITTQTGNDITFNSKNLTSVGTINGITIGANTGDVLGPGSSTDNAVVRWDGTTGKLVQSSVASLSDAGGLSVVNLGTTGATSTTTALSISVQSDTVDRLHINGGGDLEWGAGSASTRDVRLYRTAANTLTLDNNSSGSGSLTVNTLTSNFVNAAGTNTGTTCVIMATDGSPAMGTNCISSVAIATAAGTYSSTNSSIYKRFADIASSSTLSRHTGTQNYLNNAAIAATGAVMDSGTGAGTYLNNVVIGGANGINTLTRVNGTGSTTDCFIAGYANSIGTTANANSTNCFIAGQNNSIPEGVNVTLIGSQNAASGAGRGNAIAIGTHLTLNASGALLLGDASTTALTAGTNTCSGRFAGGYSFFTNAGVTVGVQVGASGTSWSAISDIKTKHDIKLIDNDLIYNKLQQIDVVNFKYIESMDDTQQLRIGVIANDINKHFADCENPVMKANRKEDGTNLVSSADLGYLQLAALKSAMKKIDIQAKQITDMEDKNKSLENRLALLETVVRQLIKT